MSDRVTITIKRSYAFPPEPLFDAWLDPTVASRWLFCTPDGENVRCDIEARRGGGFIITDRRPSMGDVEHRGTYVEIDRPRRLVFKFSVPKYSNEESTVSVLVEAGADRSEVTIVGHDVPVEWAASSEQGWRDLLAKLETVL